MATQESEVTEVEESQLWPQSLEKRFIEVLIDFERKGQMQGSNFSNRVWKDIVEAMNMGCKRRYTEKQMREKFSRLKMNYTIFQGLLAHTGFGWDPITNTISATPDIWHSYLRARHIPQTSSPSTHPRANMFQKKGCANYKLLEILLKRTVATGMLQHASTQSPTNTDGENELEDQFLRGGSSKAKEVTDDNDGIFDLKNEVDRRERNEEKKPRRSKKRGAMEAALQALTEVSLARADRIRSRSNTPHSSDSIGGDNPKACVRMLEDLQLDLDHETYLRVVKEFEKESTRQIFTAIPVERKKAWVESLKKKPSSSDD